MFQALGEGVAGVQRDLNARLVELSLLVGQEGNTGVLFILLVLTFVYGAVHALGPGHGKVIVASYVLAHPLRAGQGVLLGVGVAVIHTLSAVALVTTLYLILNNSYQVYGGEPKRVITLVSYGLIAGMGLVMLVRAVLRLRRPRGENTASAEEVRPVPAGKTKDLVIPAILMGMVPCEGAVLILIFSLSINAFWLGICLAAAMSIGMAATISLVGLAALGMRKGSMTILAKRKKIMKPLTAVLHVAGAAVIVIFGVILLIGGVWS